jgi:hypothetical protein
MWNCRSCGCQAIASDLMACPHCGIARKETTMARVSDASGASNAALNATDSAALASQYAAAQGQETLDDGSDPGDAGDSVKVPAKSALKEEHVDFAQEQLGLSEEDASSATKAELIEAEEDATAELVDLDDPDGEEGGEESSAGTSSSASGSKQGKSGSTPQGTGSSTQSAVPSAENPSGQLQPPSPRAGSSADSTGGSSQETGPSRPGQQTSSQTTSRKNGKK